jgi:xanthine dehydrogenase large subunit
MGQGLYTKIVQIVASTLGVSAERIQVSSTRTDKVPNTSPTAASSGTDMNGMAAQVAAQTLKQRLADFLAEEYGMPAVDVQFENDQVRVGDEVLTFNEVASRAYLARIQLSATGFYRTPDIHFDKEAGKGRPFFYFANGAALSEVIVDGLTGEYRVSRVDILHDVGRSLNPAIDIGQIEGGFVQGMGWLTTEELLWDKTGRVISNSPANYKIPTAYDVPAHFRVALFDEPNAVETVYRSKAVGEPPLMLALSVWCALRDAAASFADYRFNPPLGAPATAEQVYYAIQAAKNDGVDSA